MKSLVVAAAAALLAFAAPALAQSTDSSHARREIHRSHARYHLRADRSSRPRYGGDDVYVRGSGDVYVREGRASAPDIPVPSFAWRPEAEQEGVGADLVGPGSNMDNPTDAHDVSR